MMMTVMMTMMGYGYDEDPYLFDDRDVTMMDATAMMRILIFFIYNSKVPLDPIGEAEASLSS